MNIVFVSEFFPRSESGELRGGAESRLFFIAKNLATRHAITIVSSMEERMERATTMFGGNVRILRAGRPRTFTQAGSFFGRASFIRDTIRLLNGLSGDILDGQNFISYLPAWYTRGRFRKKVMTVHDIWRGRWISLFGPTGVVGEVYEAHVLGKPWDLVIANSHETKKRLERLRLKRPVAIEVIYNGIEAETLERPMLEKYPRPTVTYVGRLVEYKRVQDLIAAVARVRRSLPAVRLKIIGLGPYESALRASAHDAGVSDAVEFVGHVPNHSSVLDVIARSHVFSLPSIIEGFGMVTLEAMALGVPFVNADIPVTREVTAGRGGLFFVPGNIDAFAAKLLAVLQNADTKRALGQAGRERARDFRWDVIAKQTEECYKQTVEGRP